MGFPGPAEGPESPFRKEKAGKNALHSPKKRNLAPKSDNRTPLFFHIHIHTLMKGNYKAENEAFLAEMAQQPDVQQLAGGVLYQVIKSGTGTRCPNVRSIVTVRYKGSLVNGRVFDDSSRQACPPAFRVRELIAGWQIALCRMHEGDCWKIYVPANLGYGPRTSGPIPGNSTLIFEIELIRIG